MIPTIRSQHPNEMLQPTNGQWENMNQQTQLLETLSNTCEEKGWTRHYIKYHDLEKGICLAVYGEGDKYGIDTEDTYRETIHYSSQSAGASSSLRAPSVLFGSPQSAKILLYMRRRGKIKFPHVSDIQTKGTALPCWVCKRKKFPCDKVHMKGTLTGFSASPWSCSLCSFRLMQCCQA